MPTGYTAKVAEGITLRDYLLGISRGMTYAIMQRDSDANEPVKHCTASTKYYDKKIIETEDELVRLNSMSEGEMQNAALKEYGESYKYWDKSRYENRVLKARYENLIEQVEAWSPDPLMDSTKQFALSQLRESLEYDCNYSPAAPKLESGYEWHSRSLKQAEWSIKHYTEERDKEIARAEERNRYIDAFYASLPD